ncbi:rhamnogalacturonan acetylesterase [Caulobacter sp. 602-2]|nr:rhamnogalacturonan acetylesterase [Caulobacter sp. 602-2]
MSSTGLARRRRSSLMARPLLITALLLGPQAAFAQAAAAGEAAVESAEPARAKPSKIVLVGDSTTAVSSGWGPSFCGRRVMAQISCLNLARGGRSTSSYRKEGYWQLALNELATQGYGRAYVLIQFGHNDQPGKPGRSTDLATEFPANLRRYVEEARAIGAAPVLVTPLTRRQFVGGRLDNSLEPWAQAIRDVARETGAPLIDLNRASAEAVAKLGPVESMRFAQRAPSEAAVAVARSGDTIASEPPPKATVASPGRPADGPQGRVSIVYDHTHLGPEGADYFSAMVSDLLARAVPELRRSLLP